jgi:flagellar biosynthesis chaperone FliJ
MAKALQRILRIRQLSEEQARLEVERAAQRARQASEACARQVTIEHEQRNTLAESWESGRPDDPANFGRSVTPTNESGKAVDEYGWLMEEAMLEFFGWRRMRLEELQKAELRRMEPLLDAYTERRRELRQTEQLVEHHSSEEAIKRNRRAQAETDEWYSQRTLMRRRGEPCRTDGNRSENPDGETCPINSDERVHRQF